jgi:hypothetical protein
MTVKDLIESLSQHDPEAEVHVANDRGYYQYLGCASCVDDEAFHDEWCKSLKKLSDEEHDAALEGEWPESPICDGSCKVGPVVIWVD